VVEGDDEVLVVPGQVADDVAGVVEREAARVLLAGKPVKRIAARRSAPRPRRAAPGGLISSWNTLILQR
jgi:hypothetical protein